MARIPLPLSRRSRREGAAMLIVLMVLLMTTATATFAIHSTAMEIRASGYARQATQAEHLAIGAAYAGLGYAEWLTPQGIIEQYRATTIPGGVAPSPRERAVSGPTNRLRISMSDFEQATDAPPVETHAEQTPSFGPHNAYQANFDIDGSDLYLVSRDVAGRDLTGRGSSYLGITLTSHAWLSPKGTDADAQSPMELAMRARAITQAGPVWGGGH